MICFLPISALPAWRFCNQKHRLESFGCDVVLLWLAVSSPGHVHGLQIARMKLRCFAKKNMCHTRKSLRFNHSHIEIENRLRQKRTNPQKMLGQQTKKHIGIKNWAKTLPSFRPPQNGNTDLKKKKKQLGGHQTKPPSACTSHPLPPVDGLMA